MKKGFTLLELLVVIAILGILAVAVVVALNVIGNLNKASLARAKTFSASVENSLSINQVGKWSFEEGTGTTAKDTSGYGNNGGLYNSSMWRSSTQCELRFGGCLYFDGSNFYVDIGEPPILVFNSSQRITISVWINPNTIGGSIIDRGYGNQGWGLKIDSAGKVVFGEHGNNTASTIKSITSSKWYHIVAVGGDGQETKFYVDGNLYQATNSGGWPQNNGGGINMHVVIGRRSDDANSGFFSGLMDEVAIYNQGLTFFQIQQLYAKGLPKHQLANK